ncbi:phosphate starvation-inducible protein PhoH [Sesbania bispinosa]|nr:phosphate starvation-inducible protein PhoH [Sesbania bispinosa]
MDLETLTTVGEIASLDRADKDSKAKKLKKRKALVANQGEGWPKKKHEGIGAKYSSARILKPKLPMKREFEALVESQTTNFVKTAESKDSPIIRSRIKTVVVVSDDGSNIIVPPFTILVDLFKRKRKLELRIVKEIEVNRLLIEALV